MKSVLALLGLAAYITGAAYFAGDSKAASDKPDTEQVTQAPAAKTPHECNCTGCAADREGLCTDIAELREQVARIESRLVAVNVEPEPVAKQTTEPPATVKQSLQVQPAQPQRTVTTSASGRYQRVCTPQGCYQVPVNSAGQRVSQPQRSYQQPQSRSRGGVIRRIFGR